MAELNPYGSGSVLDQFNSQIPESAPAPQQDPGYAIKPVASDLQILGTGAAGALNSALLGIPEKIIGEQGTAHLLGIDKDPTGILGKSYGIGNAVGTVLPSPIQPLSWAAKASKLLRLGKIGESLDRLGRSGNLLGTALRGATEAGSQQAIREAGEGDPNAGQNILTASLLGAGLSGVAGKIGKELNRAPRVVEQAANEADKEFLSGAFGVSTRTLKRAIGSKASEPVIDNAVGEAANVLKRYGANTPQDARDLINSAGQAFEAAGPVYNAAGHSLTQGPLHDSIMSDPVVSNFVKEYGPLGQQVIDQRLGALDKIGEYNGQRAYLNNAWQKAARATTSAEGSNLAPDLADVSTAIKSHIDDAAWDDLVASAPDSKNKMSIQQAKDVWGSLTPVRYALANNAMKTDALGTGSDTASNLIFGGLAVGDPLTYVSTALAAPAFRKLVSGVANQTVGQASGIGGTLLRKLSESQGLENLATKPIVGGKTLGTLLQRQAATVGTIAPGIYGEATGNIMQPNLGAAQKEQMPEAQLSAANPTNLVQLSQTDPAAFQQHLLNGIYLDYVKDPQAYKLFGEPVMTNPLYRQYVEGAIKAVSTNGQIDPIKASQVLFRNPQDTGLYKELVNAQPRIESLSKSAAYGLQMPFIAPAINPSGTGSRQAIADQIESLIDQGGGSGKAASIEIQRAFNTSNQKTLFPKLQKILLKYAPRYQTLMQELNQ